MNDTPLNIMIIDCCEHIKSKLANVTSSSVTSISGLTATALQIKGQIDLIVVGVPNYPVRRLFISQLREVYCHTPMLILRRAENAPDASIRGEFILSDQSDLRDLEIVSAVRGVLPLKRCNHTLRGVGYDVVREVLRVITEKFSNPDLNLEKVARALSISPAHLSRILNQSAGVSFRQLLRNKRIEEAKRLLATNQYSVKEVAAQVGFIDSHYFSRSFKASTGQCASEYRSRDPIPIQS